MNVPGPVQVELDSEDRPKTVRRSGGAVAVEAVLETWRLDDEWWRQPIARRYHEVVIAGGGRVVLYIDLVTGEWWMQKP